MTEWKESLATQLEPVLGEQDPRPKMGVYHDLPFAIFVYPPEDEFAVREELDLLSTRLEHKGKRVTRISLAECLQKGLDANVPLDQLVEAEKTVGVEEALRTAHAVLTDYSPLEKLVIEELPESLDPERDVVFLARAGSLFPFYRTSALLERLKGRVDVPMVLFYPGVRDGASGLKFMGVLDPDHAYRLRIFGGE
jgi:hypothetical protein